MKILLHVVVCLTAMVPFAFAAQHSCVKVKQKEDDFRSIFQDFHSFQHLVLHPEGTILHNSDGESETAEQFARAAMHRMLGDALYRECFSWQLGHTHQIQPSPDFTTLAVVSGTEVRMYYLDVGHDKLGEKLSLFQTLSFSTCIKELQWLSSQQFLVSFERDVAKSAYLPAVYTYHAGVYCFEENMPVSTPSGVLHSLPILGKVDQLLWNAQHDRIACLMNKFDIHIYQAQKSQYLLVDTIKYDSKELRLIRKVYANQTLSKIVVLLDNYTLLVYQTVMDLDGQMRFCKTQELKSSHLILEVALSQTGEHLFVHTLDGEVKFYTAHNEQMSVNQMLFLPALQQALHTVEGRAWIAQQRDLVITRVEALSAAYGAWVSDRWIDRALHAVGNYRSWMMRHKAALGLSMAVGVLICFGQQLGAAIP